MAFKRRSYPVHQRDIEAFAQYPVVIAVLIDAGFMTHWPHEWTRDGNRSRRRHQEPRGYDAMSVFQDANQRLYYSRDHARAQLKPRDDGYKSLNDAAVKLRVMRGEVQDAEEGDLK